MRADNINIPFDIKVSPVQFTALYLKKIQRIQNVKEFYVSKGKTNGFTLNMNQFFGIEYFPKILYTSFQLMLTEFIFVQEM